jgi:hypothetical protein
LYIAHCPNPPTPKNSKILDKIKIGLLYLELISIIPQVLAMITPSELEMAN